MTVQDEDSVLADITTLLASMAARYKGSLAARIRPVSFGEVVLLVADNMVPEFDDFEAAVIAALGRVRHAHGDLFIKDRARLFGFRAHNWKAT